MAESWDNFTPESSSSTTILSIMTTVNEKVRERIPAWEDFISNAEHFSFFFNSVLKLSLSDELSFADQIIVITFLDNCFNSLEVDIVRKEVMKICSLPIWFSLYSNQRSRLLARNKKLRKMWNVIERKVKKFTDEERDNFEFNCSLLWRLLQKFKRVIDYIDSDAKEFDADAVSYCERFLLLLIDLEAQLTTRRFANSLILASHIVVHCHLSQFIITEYGSLSCDLLSMLKFYTRFEIDDFDGMPLTGAEMTKRHYDFVTNMQKAMFKHFPDKMMEFALMNVGSVDTRKFLTEQLYSLSASDLYKIAEYLEIVPKADESFLFEANYGRFDDVAYMSEMIIFYCERRPSQLQKLNAQPLYPSEKVIWDEKLVPYEEYDGKGVLPLNKLNLQFLTLHDYLLRNFNLFQMESTYEIRQDLEDALFRMRPYQHESGDEADVVWGGWSRMALPISAGNCRIVLVAKPLVGETCPAEVKADVTVTLPTRTDIRQEWEGLRKNDVLFMVRVVATQKYGTKFETRRSIKGQFRVNLVRGCEVEGFLGPDGKVVEELESRDVLRKMVGDTRTVRVKFDANQYQLDMESPDKTDIYYSFNLVVRRDQKTNNFKAVLATIRQMLNTECVVPDWLYDIILGYGAPDAAHYSKMVNDNEPCMNFNDTFLSFEHLQASFPDKQIICKSTNLVPPFRLTFKELVPQHDVTDETQRDTSIIVEQQPSMHLSTAGTTIEGFEETRRNVIEFTPAQVEAIKSGMQPGLTVVVGPPGTGKTDVAVQIISNIYHNWPEQRTLIVTHSNKALNQLFEKIIKLDVDERHLLRMGHGEEALETDKDFSRYGRVNYVLTERLALLKRVERLSELLGAVGDVAYSCETAGYFYRYTVVQTWNRFLKCYRKQAGITAPTAAAGDSSEKNAINNEDDNAMDVLSNVRETESVVHESPSANGNGVADNLPMAADWVANNFPFAKFFVDSLFKRENVAEDFAIAQSCYHQIQTMFKKIEEYFAFELLRNGRDRADYLLVKEAKIIAMTCTHAALRRKELVDLCFRYDNVLMEESAQILEVETFIPLLLQDPRDGRNRLKRWIMIGDHHQLPPIVQNVAYQKYSNMEQSLFARFIRLGVPHIQLDAQGRARSEIAQLYSWRYKKLGDLPHISQLDEYQTANPGFLYNYQMADVPDFNGVGESTPSPYFYQNLGEAEFAVALYVYMRVLGYPAERISLITTYNGQASLIRDVATKRCAENPLIGMPGKISTVDKYQGQQNDYVILSLVRTKFVGHLRDVRRLVVALSRARLGLYVLGRVDLFRKCRELAPAMKLLLNRPTRLSLIPHETFTSPEKRRKSGISPESSLLEIVDTQHISHFVSAFYMSNVELLKQRFIDDFGEDTLLKATSAAQARIEERNGTAKRKRQPQVKIQRGRQLPIVPDEASIAAANAVTAAGGNGAPLSSDEHPMDTQDEEGSSAQLAEVKPPAEAAEGTIVFEQVDFERLQEVPKY